MKTKKVAVMIIIGLGLMTGILMGNSNCYSAETKKKAINPSSRFKLSQQQIDYETKLAKQGNAESAFRLYQHYVIVVGDENKGLYWLEKAAEQNHPIALYNVAVTYIDDKRFQNDDKAMYWLKRGVSVGDAECIKLYKRYIKQRKVKP